MAIHPTTGVTEDGFNYIQTDVNYYLDPSKGGITAFVPGTAGILRRKFETQQVKIRDLRGHEDEFKIHKHAFEPIKWKLPTDGITDEEIKKHVYPEAEKIVKKMQAYVRPSLVNWTNFISQYGRISRPDVLSPITTQHR